MTFDTVRFTVLLTLLESIQSNYQLDATHVNFTLCSSSVDVSLLKMNKKIRFLDLVQLNIKFLSFVDLLRTFEIITFT